MVAGSKIAPVHLVEENAHLDDMNRTESAESADGAMQKSLGPPVETARDPFFDLK